MFAPGDLVRTNRDVGLGATVPSIPMGTLCLVYWVSKYGQLVAVQVPRGSREALPSQTFDLIQECP